VAKGLDHTLARREQTFIFLDALDECTESVNGALQQTIHELHQKGGAHTKWLLTARTSLDLFNHFKAPDFLHSIMEGAVVTGDIELHLEVRMETDARLSSFSSKAKEMIISSVASISAEM
jgi:hypothetical protein